MKRRLPLAQSACLLSTVVTLLLLTQLGEVRSVYAQPKGGSDALPACQLHSLFPAGGKQGSSVEVKITAGADLERVSKLTFSHPGITATQKQAEPAYGGPAQPVTDTFVVTIGKDVPAGLYDVRATGYFGISNPRTFVVSQSEELLESPDNNAFAKAAPIALGTVINGQATAANADYFKFTAKKGQRVIVDVWAQRIDSKMDATLVVYDSTGRELRRNRDMNRRDPLVDLDVPADGEYTVAVYDFLYEGGPTYFYRLQAHTGPHIDYIYPPAGVPGKKSQFTIYGRNLPGGQPVAKLTVGGRPLEQLTVSIDVPAGDATALLDARVAPTSQQSMLDGFAYQLTSPQGVSSPYLVGFAAAPVTVEVEPNNDPAKPQAVTVPCEYVGQFDRRGDEDWLEFQGKKGDIYYVEIVSQRLMLPTAPQVVVQRVTKDDKGEVKTTDVVVLDEDVKDLGGPGFPTANSDSAAKLTLPDDGTYRVLIRDQHGSVGDPRRIYRLSIRQPQPDFRVAATTMFPTMAKDAKPWSHLLRRGGAVAFDVVAFRRDGFAGEIEISAEGLPKGLMAAPVLIGGDQESAALVISAAPDAASWSGAIKIVGKARVNDKEVSRVARAGVTAWPGLPGQNNQPGRPAEARVCRELALAVSDSETLPVSIEAGGGKAVETARGMKVEVPVKVTRRDGFKEALTLTPYGLPTAYKAANLTIAANANDAKLAIEVPPNANPGVLSFSLRGPAKVSYKRDQAGADAAAADKKKFEDLVKTLDAASKAAEKAKTEADAKAKAAQAALAKATDANRAELQKAQAEAEAAKTKTVAEATAAAAKLKAANDAKTAADKRATDTATAAKPKDLNVVVVSTVGQIAVAASPAKLEIKTPAVTVKKGEKAEATVAVTRLYGFADAVDLVVTLPGNLKGVTIPNGSIVKGKDDIKLAITAAKDATPGSYEVVVKGTPKINGVNTALEEKLTLKVE